jgi:hypothetical protein
MVISYLEKAIKKGIKIQLITKKLKENEREEFLHIVASPFVTHGTHEKPGVMLYTSNLATAVCFPNQEGRFTFTGFTSKSTWAINWSKELFERSWQDSMQSINLPFSDEAEQHIIVYGQDNPNYDHRAVQDAVNNFREVTLSGVFNFGSKWVTISKSCNLRGEGVEKGIPLTKIYKSGWQIPFTSEDRLILVKGKGIEVSIENIHFTDFNGVCVEANEGASFTFKRNRITLETGFSRGRRHPYGDMVIGLLVGNWDGPTPGRSTFQKGVEIAENYLDFALSHLRGGYLSHQNKWDDPAYYPDLSEEYYIGAGCARASSMLNFLGTVELHSSIFSLVKSSGTIMN